MLLITPDNAADYLRAKGLLAAGEAAVVQPLAWGVSNVVLRVVRIAGPDFVLKQSREQLRTRQLWISRLDRIYREVDALRISATVLGKDIVPGVLFEDRANYLFTMEAAPADHMVWKQLLLEGNADLGIGQRLGELLGKLHRETAVQPELADSLGDLTVFDELRIDPFYRRIAQVHPRLQPAIDRLIEEMLATRVCLVHADFSPKNVLVHAQGLTLVDYETAHWGDPAFDLGFFLSHLLLKTMKHREVFAEYAQLTDCFWTGYWSELLPDAAGPVPPAALDRGELFRRTMGHLAGCMWARIDGKSTIDYLPQPGEQEAVRRFCGGLFDDRPADWADVLAELQRALREQHLLP